MKLIFNLGFWFTNNSLNIAGLDSPLMDLIHKIRNDPSKNRAQTHWNYYIDIHNIVNLHKIPKYEELT